MLIYLIIFVILGFILAKFIKEPKIALLIALIISIAIGVFYAPMWGIVSLGEMAFGYFAFVFTKD
ncbi:hypothetical protein [Arcobacter sp.]|uniref:hypothetical protein n=1 Tax=Arcobacter sp. TaxID=1872629 RepID=UPI003C792F9B